MFTSLISVCEEREGNRVCVCVCVFEGDTISDLKPSCCISCGKYAHIYVPIYVPVTPTLKKTPKKQMMS